MQKKVIQVVTPIRKNRVTAGTLYWDNGKAVFFKKIKPTKHYMRVVQGYGIDNEVFEKYINKQNGHVLLYDQEGKNYIWSSFDMWWLYGRTAQYTKNAGKQRFLSEKYMTSRNRKHAGGTFENAIKRLLK